MKQIAKYLKSFFKEDFNPYVYLYFIIFLAVTITLNYKLDFEDGILDSYKGENICIFYYFLFYCFAYYSIALPKLFIEGEKRLLTSHEFWIKSLMFLLMIGIYGGMYYHMSIVNDMQNQDERYFVRKIISNAYYPFVYLLPLLAMYYVYDRRHKGFYGLTLKGFDPSPYFGMLLIMAPLITWASFQPDFLDTYPEFKAWTIQDVYGLSKRQMTGIYEVFYGLDFMGVEIAFRGALAISLARILGRHALLPMVATYAFLHFGKPMAETIGSVAGSYILGIIAIRTNSIWGGFLIHAGVALMMDFAALLQHYYLQR